MRYVIRNRESGTIIEEFETLEEAKEEVAYYEELDKEHEIYEPDFYEIYDTEKEEIVY